MKTEHPTKLVNGIVHAQCSRCKQYQSAHQQEGLYIDNGIDFSVGGGYGLYYDPFDTKEELKIILCHNCSVELLKFLNVYDYPIFHRGHPTERNADPCCDNCWIPVEENGQWVATKDPRTNEIVRHKDKNGNYIQNI